MYPFITTLLALLLVTNLFAQNDDRPEHTGDNFSLEGALALFKKSTSLEEYEKLLNEKDNLGTGDYTLNGGDPCDHSALAFSMQDVPRTEIIFIVLAKEEYSLPVAYIALEEVVLR